MCRNTYRNCKASRHPVEIIRVLAHCHDLWNYRIIGPLDAKYFSKLLEVLGGSLADREDCVAKPAHAEAAQFLVKKLDAELRCQQRNIFNNGQPDAPLFVLS